MKYKVTNPERKKIILTNICDLRNLKRIKQETMAKELGISKSEYSKLENGQKPNWEKYWNKIGAVLGIEPYELAFEDCLIQTKNGSLKNNNILEKARDKKEINENVYKVLNERDRLKDELLENYKNDVSYWKDKYYRMKALYLKAKTFLKNLSGSKLKKEETEENETAQSLGDVGGGIVKGFSYSPYYGWHPISNTELIINNVSAPLPH